MANSDWILDVLADLRAFAAANDLGALAEQLDDTMLVAATETASKTEEARKRGNGNYRKSGPDTGGVGRLGHA